MYKFNLAIIIFSKITVFFIKINITSYLNKYTIISFLSQTMGKIRGGQKGLAIKNVCLF